MNDSPVDGRESLARFIVRDDWVRADRTIRQNAFIPYPHKELSVTRHLNMSQEYLWGIGQDVVRQRQCRLYGRADIEAGHVRKISHSQLLVTPITRIS